MSYLDLAKAQLIIDEGRRDKPYVDTVGKITIGIGRNLTDVGLNFGEIDLLFANDLIRAERNAKLFAGSSWPMLSDVRKAVLINMAFNLGMKLFTFRKLQWALENPDYEEASRQILDSDAARETGQRYARLAKMMKDG